MAGSVSPVAQDRLARRSWRLRRRPDSPEELFLRAGARCGARPTVRGLLRVQGPVSVGHDLLVDGIEYPVVLGALPGATLSIGDAAYLNRGADISAWQRIEIGHNLRLGELASIQDWDGHALERRLNRGLLPFRSETTSGSDVEPWCSRG